MKKEISLLMCLLCILPITFAGDLDGTATDEIDTCAGTDCEVMVGAGGTFTIADCMQKLNLDISLTGLEDGNYQLSLQTYPNDFRLNTVCPNPNGPMGGVHTNAWECGDWQDYSFYNFDMDAVPVNGTFEKSYSITLPKGDYVVALLVKHDKSDGVGGVSYPIILQKENIEFTISDLCISTCTERITSVEAAVADLLSRVTIVEENNLTGPQGEQGIQGEQGWPGLDGKDGEVGPQGEMGVCECDNYLPRVETLEGKAVEQSVQIVLLQDSISELNARLAVYDDLFANTFENCNTKDKVYCQMSFSKSVDYFCKDGYGSDTLCMKGRCNLKTTSVYCGIGKCNSLTGMCK